MLGNGPAFRRGWSAPGGLFNHGVEVAWATKPLQSNFEPYFAVWSEDEGIRIFYFGHEPIRSGALIPEHLVKSWTEEGLKAGALDDVQVVKLFGDRPDIFTEKQAAKIRASLVEARNVLLPLWIGFVEEPKKYDELSLRAQLLVEYLSVGGECPEGDRLDPEDVEARLACYQALRFFERTTPEMSGGQPLRQSKLYVLADGGFIF